MGIFLHLKSVKNLLEILNRWINNPSLSIMENIYELDHHSWLSTNDFNLLTDLYTEIVRYWNAIHFVIQKTLRSLHFPNIIHDAWFYYATYRKFWEKISSEIIIEELQLIYGDSFKGLRISKFINQLDTFIWEKALEGKSEIEKISLKYAIPTYTLNLLSPVMSQEFLNNNLLALNGIGKEITYTLRFNSLIIPKSEKYNLDSQNFAQKIITDLKTSGIILTKDDKFAFLYHIPVYQRKKLLKSHWYQEGYFIFQDKGSIAAIELLNPQPNDFICDLCAAPGIKTSLIAQYTDNQACIIATEIKHKRCAIMKEIMDQLNAQNIHIINCIGEKFPLNFNEKFDRLLLDAQCTGSGTLYTDPELKWQQNSKNLKENTFLQKKLLKKALKLLKPGGTLIYSTCSLYPEEGELQILNLIQSKELNDNFEMVSLPNWISPCYEIQNLPKIGLGRLFPSLHHTQGFFYAKIRKK